MNVFAIRELYWCGVTKNYIDKKVNYWINPAHIRGITIPDEGDVCTICLTENERILVTKREAGYVLSQILKTENKDEKITQTIS